MSLLKNSLIRRTPLMASSFAIQPRILLTFRGFSDDTQGVLTAVRQFAFVGVELRLNIGTLELGVATFADADCRRRLFHDPQFTRLHDCQFSSSDKEEGVTPVKTKRHHYPAYFRLDTEAKKW